MRRSKASTSKRAKASITLADSAAPQVPGYKFELRRSPDGSRDLVVALSSNRRFAFYRQGFEADALFVVDQHSHYFLARARRLAFEILEMIDREGHQRVLFVGSSKAGFGAILIARICAQLRPSRTFHAVAFSPQVQLHPENPALFFSSYKALLDDAAHIAIVRNSLQRYGDVSDLRAARNLVVEAVYARDATVDRREVERLQGPNVARHAVNGMTHGAAFHFTAKGLMRADIRKRIERAYSHLDDEDLAQTAPTDIEALIDEIAESARTEPSLNELFLQVMSRAPAPYPLWAKPLDAIRRSGRALAGRAQDWRKFAIGKS